MSITVRILGPVTIEAAGGRLALSPKLRAVLALLAAHRGSVVSVDRLFEVLWGEEQPDAAAATLQSHISRLRRLLSHAGRIVALDRGYQLELPMGALDLDEFNALARRAGGSDSAASSAALLASALDVWRGPPSATSPRSSGSVPKPPAWTSSTMHRSRRGSSTGRHPVAIQR